MWPRGVATRAMHRNHEPVRCSHNGTDSDTHLSGGKRWPVVQRKDRLDRKLLEETIIHHGPGSSAPLFSWLEDEMHSAVESRVPSEECRTAQQHRDVAVVPTCVHA
ncbi:unnamed protein product, partial [marine sediment metagenome]